MWVKALKSIEQKLNKQVFDAWFRPITVEAMEFDRIVLKVPNKFFKEWLVNNYLDLIGEVLFVENGRPISVEFTVAPTMARPLDDVERSEKDLRVSRHEGGRKNQLNPRYTFDTFVVGASNQLPHAASIAVTEMMGVKYNPLFVYGGVGLGKTHLINAIGNEILKKHPRARIAYLSSEQFMNEFVSSLRNDKSLKDNRMDEFRRRFREDIDVLLIDDIQFIAGKDRTQDEFFHTFNALHERNKQIVLAADKYPQEINDLEERLCSRFQWGLIADIQAPEFETRLAIVKKKAEEEGIPIPHDVSLFLAETIKSNVRELEGALISLAAHASLDKRKIDIEFTRETLNKVICLQRSALTVENVQETVCKHFSVSLEQLKGSLRKRSIVLPRQVAMYLCRKGLNASLPEIGDRFGGRDHTTALAACRKVEKLIKNDISIRSRIEALERVLGF